MNLLQRSHKGKDGPVLDEQEVHGAPLENHEKGRWERSWPTIACGAGLVRLDCSIHVTRIILIWA